MFIEIPNDSQAQTNSDCSWQRSELDHEQKHPQLLSDLLDMVRCFVSDRLICTIDRHSSCIDCVPRNIVTSCYIQVWFAQHVYRFVSDALSRSSVIPNCWVLRARPTNASQCAQQQ